MTAVVRAAPTPTKAPAPVAAPAPARVAPVMPTGPRLNLGGGAPIPTPTRMRLESSLGANLSGVRVHSGPGAATAASNLNARAFAFGPQIVLGSGQRADDLPLMGHEAAHVIQQQAAPTPQRWADGVTVPPTNARGFAGPAVVLGRAAGERATLQRWTPSTSDRYEGEANRAAAAVVRGEPFTVTERTAGPRVQRFGLGDVLDYFADKANNIPGFRMFTIVLGVNPINMSGVDRGPANILRAVIEFIPGGKLIADALDNHGILDKVANWVAEQIKSLGMIGSAIKDAVMEFLDSLGWRDIFRLGDVWRRAKRIFTVPIDRIIDFAKNLITGIITLIKKAILIPLAKLAERTPAWDLLIAVLGRNPITDEPVPQTAETLIAGFLKLIGQEAVWENIKRANALGRTWAWFKGALGGLLALVSSLPGRAIATFKSLELADIILVPRAFAKVGAVFGTFLGNFTGWAGTAVWNLLEIVFDSVSPGAFDYIKRTGAALKSILKNPLPFVGNLVKAAKLGFQNFAGNFGTHFKAGLLNWLTGSLPGLYIPTSFSLIEIGKFVLSVLGVSWPQIRGKIVKALGPSGETIMTWAETGVDVVVALVKGGPAAAWEVIKEKLTDLKDTVIGGITDMVVDFVVKTAIPKLIAMFIPGVGFIPAIVSIYQTIQTFMQQLAKIAQVIKGFIDSIVVIAAGNIGAAAGRVESILAGLLSLAISFLAGAFGLGKVSDKVRGIINKIRAKIDKAIDAALAWIVAKAKALFAKAFSKDKTDDRTPEQKGRDKLAAIADAEKAVPAKGFDEAAMRKQLGAIKSRYKLLTLNLVVDSKTERTEAIHFTASASDEVVGKPKEVGVGDDEPAALPLPTKGASIRVPEFPTAAEIITFIPNSPVTYRVPKRKGASREALTSTKNYDVFVKLWNSGVIYPASGEAAENVRARLTVLYGAAVAEAVMKRSDLADNPNILDASQAHHILPIELLLDKRNDILRLLVKSGWDYNAAINGVPLQVGFHGNHPKYTQYVQRRIDAWVAKNGNSDAVVDSFRLYVVSKLIPEELTPLIERAWRNFEATKMTLNDYFASLP